MPEIITPIIHLNGDRYETLIEQLEDAYEAVGLAMDALQRCAPNSRNSYPIPGRLPMAETAETGEWYPASPYLRIKPYGNGNLHVIFTKQQLIDELNRRSGNGALPGKE
jgi:hypothetical protein